MPNNIKKAANDPNKFFLLVMKYQKNNQNA